MPMSLSQPIHLPESSNEGGFARILAMRQIEAGRGQLLAFGIITHPPAGLDGFSTQKHVPTAIQACEYSKS